MSVTLKDVKHIAELARLEFSGEELESFTHQLNQILEYVEKLNELDTENVEPLSHPIEGNNIFREDKFFVYFVMVYYENIRSSRKPLQMS